MISSFIEMQRLLLISTWFFLNFIPALAQNWEEVKMNSSLYLWGEGWGTSVDEADQQALADLLSKISVVVSSDFSITEDERTVNGQLDSRSYINSKIQTYSSATLTNTERLVLTNSDKEVHVGRFIRHAEVNRIFEGRIRNLKEYVRLGQVAEQSGKIDDALRDYYWAYSLLKSVQNPASVTYQDEDGKDYHLMTWLPEHLRQILGDLDVQIMGHDGTYLDLMFTYKGSPVSNLDFTYFDGRDWSNICSAKNGRGTIEFLKGMIPAHLQINYEYAYRGQAHINQEVNAVLNVVKGHPFPNARASLATNTGITSSTAVPSRKYKGNEEGKEVKSNKKLSLSPVKDEKPYLEVLNRVCNAIQTRTYDSVLSYFTEDGKDMFQRLIKYGSGRILNSKDCTLYQFGDNVVARSIQMSFTFKRGVRTNFVEDIVFTFNQNCKIDCVSFGLDQKAKDDIMNKDVWPIEARQTIMEFLESYKTAYSLKRLDYLKTIFDDDAVIIVGHVANKMKMTRNKELGTSSARIERVVRRQQYSKDQYMKHLEACFRSNEFINIRFANNDVRKAKDGEEYGIQIKQDYYSTTYGDEGYLYIQVDLTERKEPIIKVRTWQEKPDPDIGLFGMGNW